MAHDVFISYASGDKVVADAACAMLEAHGIRCWMAPRDVLPGIHYGEAIIDAIHECRIMVLVFSAKANLSSHIPKEIERAVSQGSTVMPVRIEDVAPAKSLDYFIGSVHWLDALTPPMEAHLQRLAANIHTLLARQTAASGAPLPVPLPRPVPAPAAAQSAPQYPSHPKWTYTVIAALAAAVLVLAFVIIKPKLSPAPAASQSASAFPATVPAALAAAPSLAPLTPTPAHPASTAPAAKDPAPTKIAAAPAAAPAPAAPASKPPVPAAIAPVSAPTRDLVFERTADATVKLEQLIGDQDKQRQQPTLSQTLTRFGIAGAELGSSFEHQGQTYFLFGDVIGNAGRATNAIAASAAADPAQGVRLDFLTAGGHPLTIDSAGAEAGPLSIPVAGIGVNGQIYIAVRTNSQRERSTQHTLLTKFTPPDSFQSLRTVSELPGGHFITMSLHAQPQSFPGLPPGGPFVFVWGTGLFRQSDAYLAAVPAAQFETGQGTRYFSGLDASGKPSWSNNEADAQPILKDGTLGDLSVTWCKDLNLWLMTYDTRGALGPGIVFSYSRTPWGPWSEPQLIFNPAADGAYGKYIHNPLGRRDDGLAGPVFGPKNRADPNQVRGLAYAPYVVERWTKVQGSELDLHYVMSTFNPYVVVLMKSRLKIE